MTELTFKKCRVAQIIYRQLKAASDELSQKSGENYELAGALFGRLIVALIDGLVVAMVATHSRPSKTNIVAVDSAGMIYLPALRKSDIDLMAVKYSLSPKSVQQLRELAHGDVDGMR